MSKMRGYSIFTPPIQLYFIIVALNYLLWIPFPSATYFLSGNSLVYAFLFAVGAESRFAALIALVWIPIYLSGVIVSFFKAYKQKLYGLLYAVMVADLVVSLIFILVKIFMKNHVDLCLILLGYLFQLFYSVVIITQCKRLTVQDGGRTGDGLREP